MTQNLHTALNLYNSQRFTEAAAIIDTLIQGGSLNAKAYHLGAMAQKKLGNLDKSQALIKTALAHDAHNHETHNTAGNIAQALGDILAAEQAYKQSLSLREDYVPAQQNLAFLQKDQQDPTQALPAFERLIALKPNQPAYELSYIQTLQIAELNQDALDRLETVTKVLTPDVANYTKGQILFALGRYDDALLAYEAVPQSSPHYSNAVQNILQTLSLTGKKDVLMKTLNAMITKPRSGDITALAIKMTGKLSGETKKVEILQKQLGINKEDPFLLNEWADYQISQSNHWIAFEAAEKAAKLKSGHVPFLQTLTTAALGLGELDYAEAIIDQALRRQPNDQFWLAMLCSTMRLKGQSDHPLYNFQDYITSYTLPVPKGYESLNDFLDTLKSTLNSSHEFKSEPLDQTVRGGIQTKANLVHVDNPVLKAFFASVKTCLDDYVAALENSETHPFLRRVSSKTRIMSAWSVRLTNGGFHVNHVHPEGWISSAFYVQLPDNVEDSPDREGWIQFGKPPFDINGLEAVKFIKPEPGKLALFPSYVWHGTVPIRTDQPRLTLPFDVLPA